MIRCVTGLPGGGKTYFLVTKIVEELAYTERHVVTNLEELNRGRINEYLQQKFPDQVINLDERLTIISKTDTFYFYRYRSGGLILPMPPDKDQFGKQLHRADFLGQMVDYFKPVALSESTAIPCSYFLSEAHEYFNAREWADIGRPVLYYSSKHRHLHDEVVFETQFVEQLEATLKRLTQEFHRIRNYYTMSLGPFSRRGHFRREAFHQPPGASAAAYEKTEFQMDPKGVGSCYNTTGALGIMNRGAEKKGFGKKRRLPWWSLWVIAGAVALAIGAVMMLVPRAIGAGLGSLVNGANAGLTSKLSPSSSGTSVSQAKQSQALTGTESVPARPPLPSENLRSPNIVETNSASKDRVTMRGYAIRGRKLNVMLSDGRTYTEADSELGALYRASVSVDGRKFFLAQPSSDLRQISAGRGVSVGAGVESTPDRQDGPQRLGEGPPDVVSADVPTARRSGAGKSSFAAREFSQLETPLPQSTQSSWVRDADGVQRLRERVELGR